MLVSEVVRIVTKRVEGEDINVHEAPQNICIHLAGGTRIKVKDAAIGSESADLVDRVPNV